jgi:ribosomal small subunit protein bTHX
MGKGDKKSRRGKIIIGSNGVRRPKSSKKKGIVTDGISPLTAKEKVSTISAKPKAEVKPKVKVIAAEVNSESELNATPVKTTKKAVKKVVDDDAT